MSKEQAKQPIKENEFFGAPGGGAGAITYQPGSWAGTAASPEVSQNPDNFYGRFANDNKAKNQPANNTAQQLPKTGSLQKDVNAIYAKRDVPTPDEVITGIKYELGQQIKKDKLKAKQTVLDNLKKDPHFYGKLKMLNITDKDMVDSMNESKQHPNDSSARPKVTVNLEETKKIFAEMGRGHEKKYVVNSQIVDVMKEMWEAKRARNLWRG